jgi:hypothetical protein
MTPPSADMIAEPVEPALPPLGMIGPEDHSAVVAYLGNLAREARDARTTQLDYADSNLFIYTWGDTRQPSESEVVANHIQDDVQAITDQQTKEPARKIVTPVERGEPGEIYYLDPAMQPFDENGDPLPVDQTSVMMQQQAAMLTMTQPPGIFEVNDKTLAKFWQKQLDFYWKRGKIDKSIRLVVLYTNIFGWYLPLYEWNDLDKRPKLHTNISLRQVYIDPTIDDIEEAAYAGVDWLIDAGAAKQMFPHLADVIEQKATADSPSSIDSSTEWGSNVDRKFERKMIRLRIFWLRNQPGGPMEPDEAVARGLVEAKEVIDEQAIADQQAAAEIAASAADGATGGFDVGLEQGIVDSSGVPAADAQGRSAPSVGELPVDEGLGGQFPVQPAVPTRTAYFLPGVEAEASPEMPGWPQRSIIRQLTQIESMIADDRECEYWDIPMLHTVAIPIPNTPFGQGLPQKLIAMQRGRCRALTAMVEHANYFRHPMLVIPESAWAALPDEYKQHGADRSGMILRVPDQTFNALGGKFTSSITPEPIGEPIFKLQELLKNELNERSGHPEVLQGKQPGQVTGWQSIQLLSQNAANRYGFSVQWTADMVERLAMLVMHSIIWRLSVQDLMQVCSEYPEHIVRAFQLRGQRQEWEADVSISNVAGAIQARDKQEAVEAWNLVDPATGERALGMQALRERLDIDHDEERERYQAERQQLMAMQAQAMAEAGVQQPGEEGKEKEASSNGDGFGGRMAA